jgi:SAM-dependent methyltransferase
VAFQDLFSERAAQYTRFRPDYPPELIAFAASLAAEHDLAWDCGTGNGQAAHALAEHFRVVIATDASAEQIAHARPHDRVAYRVARAENSGLPNECADLVTVAQALHWFDADAFFAEARRVLKPSGTIVIWSYGDPSIDAPDVDAILQRFNFETMEEYWPVERRKVREAYSSIALPFDEIATPTFGLERSWTRAELVGYVGSWSAVARYRSLKGDDPVPAFDAELARYWSDVDRRTVHWPLTVRAGRKT